MRCNGGGNGWYEPSEAGSQGSRVEKPDGDVVFPWFL